MVKSLLKHFFHGVAVTSFGVMQQLDTPEDILYQTEFISEN